MTDRLHNDGALVQFSERLTNSQAFGNLFREGMDLVEETAAYLDGVGRTEAKALDRAVSLTYATESMRLTTRLMQLASWLLIRRAVCEGELTPEQAKAEQSKIKLPVIGSEQSAVPRDFASLPPRLRELIEQSIKLQERVIRLDQMLGNEAPPQPSGADHPLKMQLSRLRSAFGKDAE